MSVVVSLTIVMLGTESEALDHIAAFMEASQGRILDQSVAVAPDMSTHVVVAPSTALRIVSTAPLLQWKPFQDLCRRHNVLVPLLCLMFAILGVVFLWLGRIGYHPGNSLSPSLLYAVGNSMMGVGFGIQVLCFNRQKIRLVLQTLTFWYLSVNVLTFMACQAFLMHLVFGVPASVVIVFLAFAIGPVCVFIFAQDASPYSLKRKAAVILSLASSMFFALLLNQTWLIHSVMSPDYFSQIISVHDFQFLHTTLQSLIVSSAWSILIFSCKLGFFCLWKKEPYILLNAYLKDLHIEDQESDQKQLI